MPANADPMFVFHRIRAELQRLLYLKSMHETTMQLINGVTKLEPRYSEAHKQHVNDTQQALAAKPVKPRKLTDAELRLLKHNSYGFAAFMNGLSLDDCPPAQPNEMEMWRTGWQRGYDKHEVAKQPGGGSEPPV